MENSIDILLKEKRIIALSMQEFPFPPPDLLKRFLHIETLIAELEQLNLNPTANDIRVRKRNTGKS